MNSLLSLEKTKKYLIAWREQNDKNALNNLIDGNIGLIKYFIGKYKNKGLSIDELKSACFLGLMEGINKFDYLNFPINTFSSYIARAIKGYVIKELLGFYNYQTEYANSLQEPIRGFNDDTSRLLQDRIASDVDVETNITELIYGNEVLKSVFKTDLLTDDEKKLLIYRYFLEYNLTKIGQIFGITKSAVSAREARILEKIRNNPKFKKKYNSY